MKPQFCAFLCSSICIVLLSTEVDTLSFEKFFSNVIGESNAIPQQKVRPTKPERLMNDEPMLRMMDGLNKMLSGGREFDRRTYRDIRTCMAYFDKDNARVQDAAWQGMIDYWNLHRNGADPWGKTPSEFKECNVTVLSSVDNMDIYEPCSSASNFAYYFSLLEICHHQNGGEKLKLPREYLRAIGLSISSMAMASTFFHASNTNLGYNQDLAVISAIAYTAYQAKLSAIPYSAILHDLSLTPRKKSSIEMAAALQNMYLTQPSSRWMQITNNLQLPTPTFIILITLLNLLAFVVGYKQTTLLANMLLPSLPLKDESKSFITNHYLDEMQRLRVYHQSDNHFLKKRVTGAFSKFIHAMFYNENYAPINDLMRDTKVFLLLNGFNSLVTKKFNSIIGTDYHLKDFQNSKNIYPNEVFCNAKFPHARWHVLSALSIVDIVYHSDEFYSSSVKHQRKS